MKKLIAFLKRSVLLENPVLSLFVGITPLLACSSKLLDGVFMGLCAIVSLLISSMLFRLLRKIVPEKLRDIVFILTVAVVVALCEILLHAFLPTVYESLGMYLPLLSVSGLIFSRSKKFCEEEKFSGCVLEGLSCGIGFFAICTAFALVREFFGCGSVAGFAIIPEKYAMSLVAGPVGGFMLLGIGIALGRKLLAGKKGEEENK